MGRMSAKIAEDVYNLKSEIIRLGTLQPDGYHFKVKFGVLANDDRCADMFNALDLTLRAARTRKIVEYRGGLLVQGVHDDVDIFLVYARETVM